MVTTLRKSAFVALMSISSLSGCSSYSGIGAGSPMLSGLSFSGSTRSIIGRVSDISVPVAVVAGTDNGGNLGYLAQSKTGSIYRVVNSGIPVIRYGENIIVVLPTDRFFEDDSETFVPEGLDTLHAVSGLVAAYPRSSVTIAGYTDDVGTYHHNMQLSQNQAHQILSYFWANGVDFHRMRSVGYGVEPDVASNLTSLGSHFNRRIEVRIHPESV
jgi:outer membrane protein OmpA-like peptidoglycan-associated protein